MVALLVSEADSEAVLAVSLAASLKASMVFSADLEAVSAVSLAASPAMLVASSADLEAVSAVLLVASLAVSLASLGVLGSSPVELHYNIPSKATEVMAMTFGRPMTGGGGGGGGKKRANGHSVVSSTSFNRVEGKPFVVENISSNKWRAINSSVHKIRLHSTRERKG